MTGKKIKCATSIENFSNLRRKIKLCGMGQLEIFKKWLPMTKHIYAFVREKDGNKVVAFFNLSESKKAVTVSDTKIEGIYKNLFTNEETQIPSTYQLILSPWDYQVFYK